jgi:hypothetical protein
MDAKGYVCCGVDGECANTLLLSTVGMTCFV